MEYSHNDLNTSDGRKKIFGACVAFLTALSAVFLTSCESTGGRYGPGAGIFDAVIVDAGHGGHDQGAKACFGAAEKALTLDTARRLANELRRNGFAVTETRSNDNFITLGRRVAISNASSRAVFVSVHYNWTTRRAARGIEVYYDSRRSKRMAANVLREVLRVYRTENRGIKDRGFYVLRNNKRPAILCELGFVSNADDNRNIQSAAVRQKLAERIAAGIVAERAGRQP
ncbi:MAG: N-acetylmuramoyl-L-alanine amidase family protein [Terrimicrobiaceae bacterium]